MDKIIKEVVHRINITRASYAVCRYVAQAKIGGTANYIMRFTNISDDQLTKWDKHQAETVAHTLDVFSPKRNLHTYNCNGVVSMRYVFIAYIYRVYVCCSCTELYICYFHFNTRKNGNLFWAGGKCAVTYLENTKRSRISKTGSYPRHGFIDARRMR